MSELSANIENSSLQIWPNPSEEYLQIMSNESGTYELIDFTGKKKRIMFKLKKWFLLEWIYLKSQEVFIF